MLISFHILLAILHLQFNVTSQTMRSDLASESLSRGTDQEKQSIFSFTSKIDNKTKVHSLVYLPEGYQESEKKYPLLMFLHGSAEAGSDLEKVKRNGPPKLVEDGKSFPYIIVSPQLSRKITQNWDPELVDEIYEKVKEEFRIDEKKFYLTGVSMGGAGTWNYALTHPEKLAAIAPICGWGNPSKACEMKDVPTWAFHGEEDRVINVKTTKGMIDALQACGAAPKLTLYPKVGHDAWTRAYADPELFAWLSSQENDDKKKAKIETSKNEQKETEPATAAIVDLQIIASLPVSLKESSGLIAANSNSFWSHNDSGNSPVLFNIDSTGKVKQIKRISNATNFDWEDLTVDSHGNFYIGDFGNNKNTRRTLQVYKIPNPENIVEEHINAESIEFIFEDQKSFPPAAAELNFDVEAMINFHDSLYLFTKNNSKPYSGICKVYALPNKPGTYIAELKDSITLGNSLFESSITGAAVSSDLKNLVLLSYSKLFIFSCFDHSNFFSGEMTERNLPFLSQKEAVSIYNDSLIYITDEVFHNIGGNLYSSPIQFPDCL